MSQTMVVIAKDEREKQVKSESERVSWYDK